MTHTFKEGDLVIDRFHPFHTMAPVGRIYAVTPEQVSVAYYPGNYYDYTAAEAVRGLQPVAKQEAA